MHTPALELATLSCERCLLHVTREKMGQTRRKEAVGPKLYVAVVRGKHGQHCLQRAGLAGESGTAQIVPLAA